MIHTPTRLHKMKATELNGLKSFLSQRGSSYFQKFVEESISEETSKLTEIRPVGTNEDYYQWGFKQGALKIHQLYKDLINLIDLELKRREDLPADDLTAQ